MNHILKWSENLPDSWTFKPLKAVAKYFVSNVDKVPKDVEIPVLLCNYTDVYKNEYITNNLDFMHSTATEEEIIKFRLLEHDVIITKDSESWDDIGIPALVVETNDKLVCGYHLAIIRANENTLFGPYLFRCLQSKIIRLQLELASTGVTRFGLSKDEIGRLYIPIPPFEVQLKIAKFLDKEIKDIDNLVFAKEKLIEKLDEKKQVVLTNILTSGIEKNVEFKETNLNLFPKIPKHWQVSKIKFVTTKIGSGVTPKGGSEVYVKEGIPFFRSQNVHFNGLRIDDLVYIKEETHQSMSNSKIEKGDVLLNITGASLGRCYYYDGQLGEANVNQHVCILRPNDKIQTKFLYYLISSNIGQNQIEMFQTGGGREGLNFEDIKSFVIPLPSKEKQDKIVKHIEDLYGKLNKLIEASAKSINLLKERRNSLINSAVTGKLNIN